MHRYNREKLNSLSSKKIHEDSQKLFMEKIQELRHHILLCKWNFKTDNENNVDYYYTAKVHDEKEQFKLNTLFTMIPFLASQEKNAQAIYTINLPQLKWTFLDFF